jgi:hypothetical protein
MDFSSPVTGTSLSGLTTPTYTIVPDTAPGLNGKQWAVSALGGTQTGVAPNSVGAPFTATYSRPTSFRTASDGVLSAQGIIADCPTNRFKRIVRKAVNVNDEGGSAIMWIETTYHVPVNSTIADPTGVKACMSFDGGLASQDYDDWFDAIHQGTL